MKRCTLSLAVALGASLAHTCASAAGFIDDSKASLTLRNFYIDTDNRNGAAAPSKQSEWGQGFLLNYASGYTQGTVGFGVDALGLLGVRLDGGGKAGKPGIERQPGTVFPLAHDGTATDNFSSLGLTAKARWSKTELRYGTLLPKLPVVVYNDARLLPLTYQGSQVTSGEIDNLSLTAGQLEHTRGRNSTDWRALSIAGANGSSASARDSNHFYFAGADYKTAKNLLLQYYYGELDNFYQQHFVGLVHSQPLGGGTLKSDIRVFISTADGNNASSAGRADGYLSSGYYGNGVKRGEVDNNVYSGMFTYSQNGHGLGAGYQVLTGQSDFPYLNRGDGEGTSTYLVTDAQLLKFNRAGERTWLARYTYDFAAAGVPGLGLSLLYLNADDISGRGVDRGEWERDVALSYVIPSGGFKGLGLTWKNTSMRSGLPADTTPGVASQRDQDENRLIVSYTLPLL
ncbi:OprD family porin [Pseudomonas sp. BJa5]|uniref:OprD family porin n=1 Tax=Pseudomonas sp. BJa5 TaxID=2936270 RepID=UPI00255A1234|nr:OprD family porin [Pseudomonas sp. BGr12]MDL2420995.1 OprD family porin [Pseudomonas sp. BGr12]